MGTVLQTIAQLVTTRPRATLAILVVLTLPVAWVASGLSVSTSRTALVSDDDPHWRRYMEFARAFGIPEDLVVVVKGDDPAVVRAFMDDVGRRLRDEPAPHQGGVFYRVDLSAFEARAPLHLDGAALEQINRLARTRAFRRLVSATDPAARLAALAGVLDELPTAVGEGAKPEETRVLAESLETMLAELARFAEGGGPPLRIFDEEQMMASALRERGGGIDTNGYLTTHGGKTGVLFVRPAYIRDEIEVVLPFVTAVRARCTDAVRDHEGVSFGLTGIPASAVDELTTIAHDTVRTTIIALVGVIVLFLLYFRTLKLLLFSLVPIAFGVVWTAAAIKLLFGYVNLMSSIFLVVLIGMGIDFSVHLASRFLEERRHGAAPDVAAALSTVRAGRGVVTGAITSAGAFLAVGWSGFRGIEELGVAASLGLMLTLVFAMTAFPAVLALGAGSIDVTARRRIEIGPLVDVVLHHRLLVLVLALLLTVPSIYFARSTPFDFSLLNILPEDAESAQLMAEMIEDRELSANSVAVVTPNLEAARRMTAELRGLPSVHSVVSAASFIPADQPKKLALLRGIKDHLGVVEPPHEAPALTDALDALESTLEQLSELAFARDHKEAVDRMTAGLDAIDRVRARLDAEPAKTEEHLARYDREFGRILAAHLERLDAALAAGAMTPAQLPKELVRRFVSSDGRFAVYAVPKASVWDRPALGQFLREVRAIAPDVTGFPETFYENAELIRTGFVRAALYATIAVILLLLIDLRGPYYVAAAMVPVGLGAVWMLGAMRLFDLPYNLANIMGLPLVIGVGIDNGVHILHRFRESGSVRIAAVETGGAVVLSSLTTMVGFGSLAFASHRGYSSLGILLFLGVGACLVAAVTVLLALLSNRRSLGR